jgi:sec-independent protein translocase protein TatA
MPFGGVELIVLLVIILLFFGAKRVPELARSLGVGARELKKAASEDAGESGEKPASADADEGRTKAVPVDGPPAEEPRGEPKPLDR